MSEYQRVSDMTSYVTVSDFNNEMSDVLRTGSGTNIDLSGYVKTSDLTLMLGDYARTDGLSAVASSGSYSDLSGTGELVTNGAMNVALGDYATKEATIIQTKWLTLAVMAPAVTT